MNRQYEIKKKIDGWEFSSESVLEDFLWDHLREIFNINPLRRQHCSNGNYCDILAVGEAKNLTIMELKNTEDRYVIQQLTRYFHELVKEKPYSDLVKYEMPVDLIVVAPQIHNDSITDALYSKLDFKLIKFSILELEDSFYFVVVDMRYGIETRFPLPGFVRSKESLKEIDPPPKSLNTALSKCERHDSNTIYDVRKRILSSDERMKEIQLKPGIFLYGRGKTQPYAEILIYKRSFKTNVVYFPIISLWLPISLETYHKVDRVGQVIFNSSSIFLSNSENESPLNQPLSGGSKGGRSLNGIWNVKDYLQRFLQKALRENFEYDNLFQSIERYCDQKGWPNPATDNASCLSFFMELALETWQKSLEK